MRLATRLKEARASATLEVQAAAAALRARGIDVVDMGAGEPDFPTPKPVRDGCVAAIESGHTRYTATAGIAELRDAIRDRYARAHGGHWSRESVVVTAGAKQALFNLFMALLDPGDEVLIPSPCWVSFPDQVRLAEGVPRFVATSAGEGFVPSVAALEAAAGPRTRALILNSPCNPTGAVIGREALAAIVAFARARDLVVVFDETYDHFLYGGREHVSGAQFAAELGDRMALVNTFSKTYAMTGLRLGYVIAAPELARAITTFQSHTTSNATSVSQYGALAALAGPQDMVAEMQRAYAERCERVVRGLSGIAGLELVPPAGAYYAFPRVEGVMARLGIADSTALARHLLETVHVAVVPGAAFEAEGYFRLSFATANAVLDEGLRRIRHCLQS